jgi:Xaa-Pro aminopeptidase
MHAEQRERAKQTLSERGLSYALFANPLSVKWLTGFAPPPQLGPSFFAGGPALVWYAGGDFTLIVLDSYAELARATGCPVVTYLGYTIDAPIDGAAHLAAALRDLIGPAGASATRTGIEQGDLPVALWTVLRAALPAGAELVEIDGWLLPLQTVKTAEELAKLRENFALTDAGHAAARRAVRAGLREIDVWVALEGAIQQAAGERIPVGNDCVVGYRQNNMGGWPGDLVLRPHDSLIVDLSTLRHGYWSDSCATYYAGEPTSRQRELHRTVTNALEFAVSLIKPGAISGEIDRAVRDFIAAAGYPVYPHHTGHSVGVTGHGEPRIVPYNTTPLEEGMVLMLEPGIYYPGETGVRLEDAVLVTATGAEILTHHDKSLP